MQRELREVNARMEVLRIALDALRFNSNIATTGGDCPPVKADDVVAFANTIWDFIEGKPNGT
jgi:hypothetical protein